MFFVTLWVLGFLEVLQPVSVESPNTVSGRYLREGSFAAGQVY